MIYTIDYVMMCIGYHPDLHNQSRHDLHHRSFLDKNVQSGHDGNCKQFNNGVMVCLINQFMMYTVNHCAPGKRFDVKREGIVYIPLYIINRQAMMYVYTQTLSPTSKTISISSIFGLSPGNFKYHILNTTLSHLVLLPSTITYSFHKLQYLLLPPLLTLASPLTLI